jgi:mannose-6-phosphate isomerase-like protein (cupin superfamily)
MKTIVIGGLALVGLVGLTIVSPAQSGAAQGQPRMEKAPKMPNVNVVVQHFDKEEEVKYPWGSIRWMMSSALDNESAQTFGIVQINAGQSNSLHSHPNCEEILYVISGSCDHVVGNKRVPLHAGDLIRVPVGVPHQAFVTGKEPLRAVISYSSGERKVVNYGSIE